MHLALYFMYMRHWFNLFCILVTFAIKDTFPVKPKKLKKKGSSAKTKDQEESTSVDPVETATISAEWKGKRKLTAEELAGLEKAKKRRPKTGKVLALPSVPMIGTVEEDIVNSLAWDDLVRIIFITRI